MSKFPPRSKPRNGKIDWQEQLRFNVEFAKRCLRDDGTLGTFAVIHPRNGQSLIVVHPDAGVTKKEFFQTVMVIGVAEDAIAVALFSEAWMAPHDTVVAPSQSERRQEVIVIAICYRNEDDELEWIGGCEIIERDASGKITGTKKFDADGLGPENFRTRNIMASRRPTPAQVAEANELLRTLSEARTISATVHRRSQ